MISKSKKLLAIIIACSVIIGTYAAPIYAQEIEFSAECAVYNGVYSISGKGNSDYINAVVMPADDSSDELSTQKLNTPDYISFSMKNNNGFSKEFTLPQNFADSEYKSVIWDGAEKLEIYFMIGSDDFKNQLLSQKIKDGKLDEAVNRYGYLYEIDSKEYELLKQSVKSALSESLASKEITNFAAQYKESLLEASFKQIETAQEVYSVLVMLGTDFTDYNSLSSDAQQAVLMKLLKNLPDSPETLKSLAEQYSKESHKNQNSASKPGGSSGSNQSLGANAGSPVYSSVGATQKPASTPAPTPLPTLPDIANHWAKDSINELVEMGIVSGSDNGNFYPENSITRAEFSKMFAGVIGVKPNSGVSQVFQDVEMSAWYYGYIMALCQQKLMTGYTDGTFRPDNNITRQEMAAAIYRVLEKKNVAMGEEADFSDIAEVSEYARTAVLRLGGAGIISGSEGKFRPVDNLTRAEAAAVMLRLYKKIKNTSSVSVADAEQNESASQKTFPAIAEMTKEQARGAEAEQLITKLLQRPMRGVTRAGFVSDVYALATNVKSVPTEQYFTDLPLSREETAGVQGAADMGFIERSDTFRPDDIITGYEAVQVLVCALGYKQYAEAAGGSFNGYMKAAENAELLYSVSSGAVTDKALDKTTAGLLLLNMLQSRVIEADGITETKLEWVVGDKTMLEKVFGIYKSTGVVKETNLNSLIREGISKQTAVIIGDEKYTADEADDYMKYLGYSVNAYYTEDNELIAVAKTEKNKAVCFPTDGGSLDNNLTVSYIGETDSRSYRYRLSEDYFFLYNGALSTRTPKQVISETTEGTIEVLDNNDDGIYDIVTIRKPEYIVVDSISKINRLIYDKNSSENTVNVYDDEGIFRFEGRNGDIRFLDIASDETYEIYASEDKKLIDLKLMSKMLVGNVSGRDEDKIKVNGTEYKTTEYFNEYYSGRLNLGRDYSFSLSSDGKIISFSDSGKNMKPGYVTHAAWSEEDDGIVVKIFTQNNKFEIYTTDDRITVDGKATDVNDLYAKLVSGGVLNDQLVFYKEDGNGKLKAIDFPQINNGEEPGKKKHEDDSLTEYKFSTSSFLYRSTGEVMHPSFNVSGSIVFIVPNDITNNEVFSVTNSSFFTNAKSYSNIKAYNLSQSGSAEVVVVRSDSSVPGFSSSSGSLVIEQVQDSLDEDGELVKKISGWINKQYRSYFIDKSVSIYKASGEVIGFGDVIRFSADGDVIKAMVCDFDANEDVFARNNNAEASDMNGGYKEFMYQFGEVYYAGDGYMYIGGGEDGRDLSYTELRNFAANTENIAIINMNEKSVRTGTLADIKTYKNSGRGDFVLIRQRNLLTMAIYVYVK